MDVLNPGPLLIVADVLQLMSDLYRRERYVLDAAVQ
jgi:hypothetical protein